jgi:hypothetical protein
MRNNPEYDNFRGMNTYAKNSRNPRGMNTYAILDLEKSLGMNTYAKIPQGWGSYGYVRKVRLDGTAERRPMGAP